MKNKPNKLLLALALCFTVSVAHAGDNEHSRSKKDKKEEKSSKSSNTQSPDTCKTELIPTDDCGPIQRTTCTSTNAGAIEKAQQTKEKDRKDESEKDRGDGKDHVERDHDNNSKHRDRDTSKDNDDDRNANPNDPRYGRPVGYHWEQNDGGVKQRKVTICHRAAGKNPVTIDVDDDGRYQGHNDDLLDTEGNCEHQDERTGKHKDDKNKGRDVHRIHKDATCGAPIQYVHKEDGKHHQERHHESDKSDSHSKYRSRDTTKDDKDDAGRDIDLTKHRKGYRWEHVETVTTTTGSGNNRRTTTTDYRQRKVTICHRMGGSRVTIDVDDDGFFHGHSKHPMDTEGRCEDQDDTRGKHTDSDNSGRDQVRLATEPDCGGGAGGSSTRVTDKNTGTCAGTLNNLCSGAGVTCKPVTSRPSRGGVRNMR